MKTSPKPPENRHPVSAKSTWAGLARELNVTDRSLRTWRAMPDAPQGPDVDAWKAFTAAEGLGQHKQAKGELADLRAELLREQILRARRLNAKEAGQLIDRQEVSDFLVEKAHTFAAVLRIVMLCDLPPRLLGQDASGIRAALMDAHCALIDRYNTNNVLTDADLNGQDGDRDEN
jgi:hypothetical protein